jgi:lipoprotein-anchoring transpeptidase ErfK/SrfK
LFGLIRDWTLGCVALENDEIRELFDLVPVKTPVRIVP